MVEHFGPSGKTLAADTGFAHPPTCVQVSLLHLIASHPDNEAVLRRWDLHRQLAHLMLAGAGAGRGPHSTETATMAAATAYALVTKPYAFGHRRKGRAAVAQSFVAHGVFAAATALAARGSVAAQHVAVPLLRCGLESEAAAVRQHTLSLGVVPLLVTLSEREVPERAGTQGGGAGGMSSRQIERQVQAAAAEALAAVGGDRESMATVAAAGTVPLRTWLLSVGPLAQAGNSGGGGDGGGTGPSRLDTPGDDDDSRGGGTPAYLL